MNCVCYCLAGCTLRKRYQPLCGVLYAVSTKPLSQSGLKGGRKKGYVLYVTVVQLSGGLPDYLHYLCLLLLSFILYSECKIWIVNNTKYICPFSWSMPLIWELTVIYSLKLIVLPVQSSMSFGLCWRLCRSWQAEGSCWSCHQSHSWCHLQCFPKVPQTGTPP